MCGIFALLNNDNYFSKDFIKEQFDKGKNRGPEHSCLVENVKSIFGFHRLAINGLNSTSNQPIIIDNILLICNGEIYNYKELYQMMNINGTTQSDCEVIIHLYLNYGMEQTLQMLDGVFSFILLDYRINSVVDLTSKCFIARDPFGVRPLFILNTVSNNEKNIVGFASEMKVLQKFHEELNFERDSDNVYMIQPFLPGSFSVYYLSNKVLSNWELCIKNQVYFLPAFSNTLLNNQPSNEIMYEIMNNISSSLMNAVYKRCLTTERPVAALLSGGLDSSLIAAIISKFYIEKDGINKLETYSIGLSGSEDLKYANVVAKYIGSRHTEIIVTEKEMFDIIPEVIYSIESYDTTTVRASIGNYLIGKYISEHSEAKVIFNGDGADEVCGGYLYMNKCPDPVEFDKETRRLLKYIHQFDVLRSDRCISSHGLEPRTPFLDKAFVNSYLSIPSFIRSNSFFQKQKVNIMEKYLLRSSFSSFGCRLIEKQILPDEILWRKKEAFSDGVSSNSRSLFVILQEYISKELENNPRVPPGMSLLDKEKFYYKDIFKQYYKNLEYNIPFYWMPKYIDATDPSARTLAIYDN